MTELPAQKFSGPDGVIIGDGAGLIETVAVDVPLQPAVDVPVTVYVVAVRGIAITVAPVVADKPVDGDHAYVPPVPAPEAAREMPGPPLHIPPEPGDTDIIGAAQFTFRK